MIRISHSLGGIHISADTKLPLFSRYPQCFNENTFCLGSDGLFHASSRFTDDLPYIIFLLFFPMHFISSLDFFSHIEHCGANFKKLWYGHAESFRNESMKHKMALASWEKELNPEPKIKRTIVGRASVYKKGDRQCNLCLTEEVHI